MRCKVMKGVFLSNIRRLLLSAFYFDVELTMTKAALLNSLSHAGLASNAWPWTNRDDLC